jgi:hypothetical protein
MKTFNHVILGFMAGFLGCMLVFHLTVVPKYKSIIKDADAQLAEWGKSSHACLTQLDTSINQFTSCKSDLKSAADSLKIAVDVDSRCTYLLYNAPFDLIQQSRDEHPEYIQTAPAATVPDGTFDILPTPLSDLIQNL